MQSNSTIDEKEVKKFEAMASEWWDPNGKFKPLHMLNPCRLQYIVDQIAIEFERDVSCQLPFSNLDILDIGCGGGLLCEPMARLGAKVVGADAASKNIPVAKLHALQSELNIDYRHTTIEELAKYKSKFDIILNMEVIEHVPNPTNFLSGCKELLKPGGILICSTINRTYKSYLYAILGAEYIMRWLPKGTHEWKKFITPDELFSLLNLVGLTPLDKTGFVFNKLTWDWKLSSVDLSVNFVTTSKLDNLLNNT